MESLVEARFRHVGWWWTITQEATVRKLWQPGHVFIEGEWQRVQAVPDDPPCAGYSSWFHKADVERMMTQCE